MLCHVIFIAPFSSRLPLLLVDCITNQTTHWWDTHTSTVRTEERERKREAPLLLLIARSTTPNERIETWELIGNAHSRTRQCNGPTREPRTRIGLNYITYLLYKRNKKKFFFFLFKTAFLSLSSPGATSFPPLLVPLGKFRFLINQTAAAAAAASHSTVSSLSSLPCSKSRNYRFDSSRWGRVKWQV